MKYIKQIAVARVKSQKYQKLLKMIFYPLVIISTKLEICDKQYGFIRKCNSTRGFEGCFHIRLINKYENFFALMTEEFASPLKIQSIPRLELCGAVILFSTVF